MDRATTPDPRRVPPARGFAWLTQSLALLRLQAGRLLLIAVLMQVILGLTQLPVVGWFIILSVPGLTAGLLEAFHVTARGGQPVVRLLFVPLASGAHSGRLLLLGALVFAIGALCISLLLAGSADLMDPALMERLEQGDVDALASLNQETLGHMVMALLVGVSVTGTLSYFTVPLIWFGDRRLGISLVAGLKALVVNWKPFLVLGLGLLLMLLPLVVVSGVLFGLAGSGGGLAVLAMGLIALLLMLFQLMLFGTQYCAYRDIFGIADQQAPVQSDDSQLLA